MKLVVQLTFNNGLGNLYCGLIEILEFVDFYKTNGYSIELVFASNGRSNFNKYIDFVKFEELFDVREMTVFSKITNVKHSISDLVYNDCVYHSSQYGPTAPGIHWWDVFFDILPQNINPKNPYNVETFLQKQFVPKFIPKFVPAVYSIAESFKKELGLSLTSRVLQFRYFDYASHHPTDELKTICELFKNKLMFSEFEYFATSNNRYFLDYLSNITNVKRVLYKTDTNIVSNDHGYYFYNKQMDRNFYLHRIWENLAEMVLLSKFNCIYSYSSLSWITTFIYYPLLCGANVKTVTLSNINIL